jgi:hypothetical protein
LPQRNGDVREHVLQEMRREIRGLAFEGMSATQIEKHVNGHRNLSEAEQELVFLVTYHAVADANGHY